MGARGPRALALLCALLIISARTAAYTVDCNHEYTDCDTELSKLTAEDEEVSALRIMSAGTVVTEAPQNSVPTATQTELVKNRTQEVEVTTIPYLRDATIDYKVSMDFRVPESPPTEVKPKARLLNLNVDELQNFANALHNETNLKGQKKSLPDLSDVNLDGDDDDEPRIMPVEPKAKEISDKFYTNLQAPFHSLITSDRGSEEVDTCKENEIAYKIGDRMDRGCEETCECMSGGVFECSPRCKHPYIRRGRRLSDPLCFESPVDECCSIVACATGTDKKITKLDVCKYGNDTYPVGATWHIGCEQTCICEPKAIVTCQPRCSPLTVSDKCINVQDPNDACCEVQVCDVSHDVHEEPENSTSSTTTTTTTTPTTATIKMTPITITTTEIIKGFEDYEEQNPANSRPLVLTEPIGSVKVLQNNSVQVNLMHMNNSEDPIHLLLSNNGGKSFNDVELKYSNLILNLEGGRDYILKTKETGTKFNFTITASDNNKVPYEIDDSNTKIGCYQDGQFYSVGEEFHIGCEQLCECTGLNTRECAALICPSHVGLELVSKGCVRWAPNPPASPPNCCPRSARCLSDGTCHYKGIAVPNWSEVPISLTGCEQRCFCENGELDCQEVCSPLPSVPPQSLRCPPNHRPAAVNISDEDCCKQWGCVPNAENEQNQAFQTYAIPTMGEVMTYVTPLPPLLPTLSQVVPSPTATTDSIDFYRHLSPVKSLSKYMKTASMAPKYDYMEIASPPPDSSQVQGDNITVFTLDDVESPFKTIHPEPTLAGVNNNNNHWEIPNRRPDLPKLQQPYRKPQTIYNTYSYPEKHNMISTENDSQDYGYHNPSNGQTEAPKLTIPDKKFKFSYEPVRKVPLSTVENMNFFLPSFERHRPVPDNSYSKYQIDTTPLKSNALAEPVKLTQKFFEPAMANASLNYHRPSVSYPKAQISQSQTLSRDKPVLRKQVTILKTKDLKNPKSTEMYNNGGIWGEQSKKHVLTKLPNPYETVLLRAVPNPKIHIAPSRFNPNSKIPQLPVKTYTAMDLEHLLNQMEVESVVNKNLGRSARKEDDTEGQPVSEPSHPPFLPTIGPEIHFPQEDIPDYDQNNIHRPANPIEPALAGLPPGLTLPPPYGDNNKKLSVISLQADSPTSVKMLFGLPSVLVGLRGSVDLRYTDKAEPDITHWYSQVFAPADEVLTTPRLEFRLTGLKPSTIYKIKGKLYLHNLPVEPESEIYTVRTQDQPTSVPMEEKRREIDSRLTVMEVNDTTAHVSWRHFNEQELMYIDGIQIRYRPVGTPIYSMTELLHHSRLSAELNDLRPDTKYEASLILIPPPKSVTELVDPSQVEFKTEPYVDPYNWTVTIETRAVGAGATEVMWKGVPAPAERWVRVFRAAHACIPPGGSDKRDLHDMHDIDIQGHDHDRHERDAFRLAARDLPPAITISGLLPNTKCRVWLELFLSNGKVKTSNVLEINTKSLDHPEPVDNEIESSSSVSARHGDYYGALVGVGAVAALGALSSLLLLLIVLRRHRPRSVPITTVPSAPRESSLPPYDNPAYKLELQQETMDL
ncbi:unnamed protein product [Arctia plantaginis]|uniref:Fibronectin type-III domain-containing protein n=1 Tax=Arctia plantaginis TaxID=874455 RepID=A0A8S1ALM1_ARCPL|nr:unnamed protein product [Arctia plantaginis]